MWGGSLNFVNHPAFKCKFLWSSPWLCVKFINIDILFMNLGFACLSGKLCVCIYTALASCGAPYQIKATTMGIKWDKQ